MKKYIIILFAFALPYLGIDAQTLTMTDGNRVPCPNTTQFYRFEFPYGFTLGRIYVRLTGGKFTTGETTQEVELNAKNAFGINVEWELEGGTINVFGTSLNYIFPISVRNLKGKHWMSNPTVSGTGTLTSRTLVNISGSHLVPTSYKVECTINIPYGAKGSTKIKVPPIAYGEGQNTSQYRWKINGTEVTNKSDTYTLNHSETEYVGKIIVTAINSCSTELSDSNPMEFTITRNGVAGNDIENITNQNITSDRSVFAKNTINVTNSNIRNNASVEMVAGNKIIITPSSRFYEGTKVHLSIRKSSVQLLSASDMIEEQWETESFLSELSDTYSDNSYNNTYSSSNSIYSKTISQFINLYPNPTNGIVYFNCSDYEAEGVIKIYTTAGALVYTNSGIKNGDQIDLSSLVKGLYLARIEINGEIFTEKIILK